MLLLMRQVDSLLLKRVDTGPDIGDHFAAGHIFYPDFIFPPFGIPSDVSSDADPVLPIGDQLRLKFGKRFNRFDVLGHYDQLIGARFQNGTGGLHQARFGFVSDIDDVAIDGIDLYTRIRHQ